MKKILKFCILCLMLLLFSTAAAEDTALIPGKAEDISKLCTFNKFSGQSNKLTNNAYANPWKSGIDHGIQHLDIVCPEDKAIASLYIRWFCEPFALDIQVKNAEGEWETCLTAGGDFYAEVIEIPGLRELRLIGHENQAQQLQISELNVFTEGELPDFVQHWQKPGDKVDMMVLSGHPDDEIIWFGGMIPYYAGERGKDVLVVVSAMNIEYRMLELLDCLWTCGVRIHPIHAKKWDIVTSDKERILKSWNKSNPSALEQYTGLIRRYKPDVLVLQDENGEYGHGVHKAVSQLGRDCAELAADPEQYPEQAAELGTWDVPKIYMHLYKENRIAMDWWQPLASFDGKTAQEVAQEGMLMHKSQLSHGWAVKDGGEHDNSLFGLWRTRVGADEEKNDFFEHLEATYVVREE